MWGGGDLYDRYIYVKGLTTVAGSKELTAQYTIMYCVARNFCCGLFLRNGDFCVLRELIFAIRTDWFFLLGINFCDFQKVPSIQH